MNWFACYTLFRKEITRFTKVWLQTVMAPVLTSLLYLLVFGHVLQDRVEVFPGVNYVSFLIPGLLMMAVIQNAFANSSSSMIQSKVMGSIVFILLPPLSELEMFVCLYWCSYYARYCRRDRCIYFGVFLRGCARTQRFYCYRICCTRQLHDGVTWLNRGNVGRKI